jgi:predicted PurR-regulated permease PerM
VKGIAVRETRVSDPLLRALIAAASLVVIVAGLRAGAALLVPLAIAGLIAVTTHPLVAWLERHRVPTWGAVGLTLAGMLLALLGPGLVIQSAAARFVLLAPNYGARLSTTWAGWFQWLEARGVDTTQVADALNWTAGLNLAGGLFANVAFLLSNAFLILFVVGFTLMEAAGLPQTFSRAFLIDRASLDRFHRVTRAVQRYLRVKTAISLMTGVLVGLWTAALGVDFPELWGLLAFLLNYIPNFGSIIAGVPPVLLALVQAGPGRAMVVGAGFLVVNVGLGNIVEPYVMGRRLRISPLVVVLTLVFWGWVWGSVGMVLAVPITMIVRILLEESPDLRWLAVLIAGGELPPAGPASVPTARDDRAAVS